MCAQKCAFAGGDIYTNVVDGPTPQIDLQYYDEDIQNVIEKYVSFVLCHRITKPKNEDGL